VHLGRTVVLGRGARVVVLIGLFILGRQLGSFVPGWHVDGFSSLPTFGP